MLLRSSTVFPSTSLSMNWMSLMCRSPTSKSFRKSISKSLLTSCPKMRLKPTSVNGLINLPIFCSFFSLDSAKLAHSADIAKGWAIKEMGGGSCKDGTERFLRAWPDLRSFFLATFSRVSAANLGKILDTQTFLYKIISDFCSKT